MAVLPHAVKHLRAADVAGVRCAAPARFARFVAALLVELLQSLVYIATCWWAGSARDRASLIGRDTVGSFVRTILVLPSAVLLKVNLAGRVGTAFPGGMLCLHPVRIVSTLNGLGDGGVATAVETVRCAHGDAGASS
eukprot:COSAG05_NODE_1627_length_4376_cov_3.480945_3_plen_137_part_00